MNDQLLLTVDIGNTHITLGIFYADKLGPRCVCLQQLKKR